MERATKPSVTSDRLGDVAALFLKLGWIAFGGPAAHIALMRDEVVRRRGWLTDQEFLDLLGATNLIPGPNSTELAIHLGYRRAGWRGLIAAGVLFILPAMLIVMTIAWLYVTFGTLPAAGWLLDGVKPVMIAIVVQALVGLTRAAVKDWLTGGIAAAAGLLALLGVHEIAILVGGAVLVLIARHRRLAIGLPALSTPFGLSTSVFAGLSAGVASGIPFSLSTLFLTFLKIGAVLYGSGYVLLAFLRADFVERLGWLTDRQLLDAIAVGQVTPGPVFTTATFVGYILGGLPGALVATIGIFLPSFVFVALSHPFIPWLRQSPWAASLLDGVNAAALGLMAAVTLVLARAAFIDALAVLLAIGALIALVRLRINSAWLVLGGALVGLLFQGLR